MNKLLLNVNKAKFMLVCSCKTRVQIQVDGVDVERVQESKFLVLE